MPQTGHYFTTPTLPFTVTQFSGPQFPSDTLRLESIPELAGQIKWFINPLEFRGDPESESNMTWVGTENHRE